MKRIVNSRRKIRIDIEKVSDRPFYSMRYSGNDGFDEYIARGAQSLEDYCSFIDNSLIHNGKTFVSGGDFCCSAFTARNKKGDVLFARNMDCNYAIPMLLSLTQSGAHGFVSLVNMAFLDWDESTFESIETDSKLTLAAAYSPSDGMNEYGLAVAVLTDVNSVYPRQNYRKTLFDLTLPRLLLSKATSVEEAVEYAGQFNYFYDVAPLHYIAADASGRSAVIEFVNGKMVKTTAVDCQAVTNFTLYGNSPKTGFGIERYDNICKVLELRRGVISEEEALALLKENVISGDEQWSAVYNLTQKTLSVTFSGEYERIYRFGMNEVISR